MATRKLPDPLEKRNLLYSRRAVSETQISYGDQFLEGGHLDDALEFYGVSGHVPGIERVKRVAVEEGETGILARMGKGGQVKILEGDWRAAAQRASQAGKHAQAAIGFARAGDRERAQAEASKSPGAEIPKAHSDGE